MTNVTDIPSLVPLALTPTQLETILAKGKAANDAILAAAAQGQTAPVGVWKDMYEYIYNLIAHNPAISDGQKYWFQGAQYITSNQQNVPSGYFVRDVTAVGFGVSGPSDPSIQAISDAIGEAVYDQIKHDLNLPNLWTQLNLDIYSALSGPNAGPIPPNPPYPYNYPTLPIQSWGGTFFYWNFPFNPSGNGTEATPPSTSIGDYVLANSGANATFVVNYSQAIADTTAHFVQTMNVQPDQIIPSMLGIGKGFLNLYNAGWKGKLDIVEMIATSILDYAKTGNSVAALETALTSFVARQVGLYLADGSTAISAGGGSDVFVGGQGIGSAGNDTLTGGGDNTAFLINLPASGSITETINDGQGTGQIVVANNGQFDILGGSAASPLSVVAGQQNTWQDAGGTQYVFNLSTDQLLITGGYLGSGNEVVVDNFNIASATGINPNDGTGGFIGIYLPQALGLTAGAAVGANSPATFAAGSTESYTLSVDAPSATAQTLTVTLSGANPSDFEALIGNNTIQLNGDGTFTVTLAAGETSVSFGLVDTTPDDGTSDIAGGATLHLVASLPGSGNSGAAVQSQTLNITYTPGTPETSTAPQPFSVITGTVSGGVTTYQGDGGDDSIAAGAGPNKILAANSGNDIIVGGSGSNTIVGGSGNDVITLNGSQDLVTLGAGSNTVNGSKAGADTIYGSGGNSIINGNGGTDLIFAGDGDNGLYAGTQANLTSALAQAHSASATHRQGDVIAALDGDNTIVGGNGNDLITVGTGNDVIVLGPGNDVFEGGVETTNAQANWSWTIQVNGRAVEWGLSNVTQWIESYTNPYVQPYFGSADANTNQPYAAGNDTVFGGTGNDLIALPNGNNYVEAGSGNTTVLGGMGNDTIIAGSGNDLLIGGGGNEYFYGGSGTDTIFGGDGNNTIIGGSGNATIEADAGDLNGTYTGANLEKNYVNGGSGNDVIYGSSGSDTLIGGTGNVTIYGGSGNENMTGGSGNDALVAGTGNATLSAGGGGRDTLQGGTNSSSTYVIYGGTGTDLITAQDGTNILYAGDGGTANAATSVFASQTDAASQTTIYGGAGVDSLTGGAGNTVMYAGDGGTSAAPTSVYAFSGNTTIYGGLGTDVLQGGSGTDVIYAGDGGTASAPTTVVAGTGAATLYGGGGVSILQDLNSGGQDLIVAGTADDTLIGVGNDTLVAGPGNDFIQNNGGASTVELTEGFGTETLLMNGGSADNLVFGTGITASSFSGFVGLDSSGNAGLALDGASGSVFIQNGLTGALGAVSFADSGAVSTQTLLTDAFGGDQTINLGSGKTVLLNLGNSEAVVGGLSSSDTVASFGNNVTISGGSGFGANNIYATGTGDSIATSQAGQDTVNATGNNDTIVANYFDRITVSGSGSEVIAWALGDTITASGANDTLVGANSTFYVNDPTTVIQATNGGADTVFASVSYTAPTNVNVLVLTGSANIEATGNSGNDSLIAGAGNDTLVAGSGIDTLIGGTGNTTFVINNAADVIVGPSNPVLGSILSSVSLTLPVGVDSIVLTGTANLQLTANGDNDTLVSNSGIDTLVGGAGNDIFVINNAADVVQDASTTTSNTVQTSVSYVAPTNVNTLVLTGTANLQGTANAGNDTLVSNSGVDTLVGGSGNDTFIVNNAADVVQDGSATASNTIQSSVSYTLPTNVNALTLTGSANLIATGNGASDVIRANSGADTLVAGSGIATLIGGSGNDIFVVNNTADVVQDSSATASNTVQSSVSYRAPTDVNTIILTGTANIQATANGGSDTLISNSGIDTLVGGSGNDTFVVNNAADVILDTSTTASNIVLSSVSYALPTNVGVLQLTASGITGTADRNFGLVTDTVGNDTLVADDFQDTLVGGPGPDTFVGNSGSSADTFVINNAADVIIATASSGGDIVQSSVSYTLPTGVDNLVLTGSANLAATANSGNDSLVANAGADTLFGGSGNDTLVAGSGPVTLWGGTGADTFVVNSTADVISNVSAVAGNTIVASINYTLPGTIDNLTLSGNGALIGIGNNDPHNTLTAGSGNDTLVSGTGVTTFVGGLGQDTFIVNNSADVVQAQAQGVNTVISSVSYTAPTNVTTLILSGTANLAATGSAGAVSIVGNAGNDTLTAGVGDETLVAGAGLATLLGGVGNDTFIINNTADVVQDSHSTDSNTLISSVSEVLPTNVNVLILSGTANLTGTANSANDSLVGNGGNDTLIAGTGNDTLVAGAGTATLVGGSGSDTFVINSSADVVQGASSGGANVLLTSVSYTAPVNVNSLLLVGPANIAATGNAGNDSLRIIGSGNDTLIAGAGIDTMTGGSGNATFVVNNTADVVQDSSTTANNTVRSSVSFALSTNVNTLVLTGSLNLVGTANNGNDTLVSNSGVDTLIGGAGNDLFIVNNAGDVIQDTSSTASNAVQASVSYALSTNVNTLTLTGSANLTGTANSGNDTLVANAGIDTLIGGAGNDTFIVTNAADVVVDGSTTASNLIRSSVSYSLPTNVNALVLTGSSSLMAVGNAGNDVITANSGGDTLVSGSGIDTLIGGSGIDTFVVNNASDVVRSTSGASSDIVESSVSYNLPTNVNTLILTGTSNLVGTANGGSDTIVSNAGVDTLVGGGSPEVFIVNNAADIIQNLTGADTVVSSVNFTLPQGAAELVLVGSANLLGTANGSGETLVAGAGNDTLVAGAFIATLVGGAGNTTFVVNSFADVVENSFNASHDTIVSSASYSLPTNVDSLILTGSANLAAFGNNDLTNVLTANSGNDSLVATATQNTVYGGVGSDTIDAGLGTNLIYAGNGGTASRPTVVQGNSSLTGTYTQTTIYGGSGVDLLSGGPGTDVIYAGSGSATLNSGTGADSLYGGSGDLVEDNLSGRSLLVAGAGAETLSGTGGDTLVAGSGPDLMYDGVSTAVGSTYQFSPGFGQDTIGNGVQGNNNITSNNDTLVFNSGITSSSLTASEVYDGANGVLIDGINIGLVISSGTGSILIEGGLDPGVVNSLTFGGGTQTLAQFMNAQGPGTQSVSYGFSVNSHSILSTGDGQTVSNDGSDLFIYGFGNRDVLSDPYAAVISIPTLIYGYGDQTTLTGATVYAVGNADLVTMVDTHNFNSTFSASATLAGANDTAVAGTGAERFVVKQSSDVIQVAVAPGFGSDSVDAFASYVLPNNVRTLTLDSSVGGLAGTSNAQGGTLIAAGSNDTLTGGAGQDTLIAQGSNDVLVGGSGIETFVLNNPTDSIQFGTGAASLNSVQANFSYTLSGGANSLVETGASVVGTGNSANDLLTATGASDTLVAGAGNDTLVAAATSAVTLVGGAGNDTFVINNTGDVIRDSSTTANNALQSSVSYTLPVNVNALLLKGSGNLTATANSANDSIVGNGGNDTIIAGSGNDTLVAGTGHDTFVFNPGFGQDQVLNAQNGDVIAFGAGIAQSSLTFTAVAGPSPSLVISGAGGSVTVQGGLIPGAISSLSFNAGTSTATVMQLVDPSNADTTVTGSGGNLILSTANNDSITGGSGLDTIIAWGNADTLTAGSGGTAIYAGGSGDQVTGGPGSDTLSASGANNTLTGGAANETFIVQDPSTVIQVAAGASNDTVYSSVSYTLPTNVSVLTLTGAANLEGTGNAGDDTITANSGNDTLVAGSGIATLVGGPGVDVFVVNNSADVVQVPPGPNQDTIYSSASNYTLPTGVQTLILIGSGGITGTGNSQNDTLSDSGGHNTLVAGSGDDYLIGSNQGATTFVGGGGLDTFDGGGAVGDIFVTGTGIDFIFDGAATVGSCTGDTFYINNSEDILETFGTLDRLVTSVSYVLQPLQGVNFTSGNVIDWDLTGTADISAVDLTGSFSGLNLNGNSGNDTLVAGSKGSFLDFITGGNGNNLVKGSNAGGSSAQSYLRAGDGNNTIVGGDNDSNNITVGNGNNLLIGGDDAVNAMSAGTGVNTFVGGASSSDIFYVNNAADVVLAQAGSHDTVAASISLAAPTNVNTLELLDPGLIGMSNSGNDTLTGRQDTLVASSGTDSLSSSGSSTLVAGTGHDIFAPYQDGDVLLFNSGFGSVEVQRPQASFGATAGPTVEFGSGISAGSITASAVIDPTGGAGLQLSVGTGVITLDGALAGQPYRFAFGSGPTLSFAQFLSQVTVVSSTVTGASGNLVLQDAASSAVSGGTGNDTIAVAGANDTITGGSGNQLLLALGTGDVIQAGTGNYTLTAYGAQDTLTSGTGNDNLTAWGNGDVLTSGSNASSAQTLTAYGTGELLTGGAGGDSLMVSSATSTSGTNDTLVAGSGAQTLEDSTDTGTNTFVVNSTADAVFVDSTGLMDTLVSSVSFTLPANLDTLILTGSANLTGVANSDNALLVGNVGSDTLTAGSGLDTLVAGSGLAKLVGGTGNDLFVVNNSGDVVQAGTRGTDTIQSSASYSLPTGIARLVLTGTASLVATGNSAQDVISANSGNDTLTAGTGVATLIGGAGNDTFVINNTRDVIQDSFATSSNALVSSVSYTLPTNVEALTLSGTAALSATGNSQSDVLTANSGSDTLTAGAGLATLVGGTGNDLLIINNVNDVVQVGATHGTDTIQSSVSYVLPENVAKLTLTGTANLAATGNSLTNVLTANSGNDTLTAGSGVATLTGGAGNDLFVVNNTSDVVSVGATHGNDTIQSSVNYTASANVANLTLTGTAGLAGTGNSLADVITGNSGADTLTAGTGIATLVGGGGNNVFVLNNASDVVLEASTGLSDTIRSSVSYLLPTNVNTLVLTGTAALQGTANSGNDLLTANTGADTLVAGSGNDTLIAGTTGADSLVGGSGTDLFEVNSTLDKVSVATAGNDTLQASVSYTLPTNVQYMVLTGTAALTATGNSQTDLIVGNTGNDTLNGGTGIAVLEGGRTAGQDLLKATGNQAALIGGAKASTLTGGAFKDFFAAGLVSDSITTGATANVISVNSGDGADTLNPTTGATDILSLGAGIDTESLFFTKTANNLVLTDGVTGDSVTFSNWYASANNQVVTKLQVVEIASASYNSSGTDALRNQALEEFNFTSLVSQFNTAGSPSNWALSNGMPTAQLSSSATQAYGGDLAYYFGLNGNLTGVNLSAAQSTLTNSSYATAAQTIDSFAGISGGSGLQLLVASPPADAASAAAAPTAADSMSFVTPAALGLERQHFRPWQGGRPRPVAGNPSLEPPAYVDPVSFAWSTLDASMSAGRVVSGVQESLTPEYGDLQSAALLGGPAQAAGRHLVGEATRSGLGQRL